MREPQRLKIEHVLSPSTARATAQRTANIDCQGVDYAKLIVNFCSEFNTNAVNPTISVLASDDTVVTNFATITADTTVDATAAMARTYNIKPTKRYLRLSVTPGTATNDTIVVSAIAALETEKAPATTTEMVVSTNDTAVVVS